MSMKDKISTIALVAIVAVGAGLVGYTFSTPGQVNPATSFASGALMSGHFTLEVLDEHGNVKAYRQTDNVITRVGEDCAAKALFSPVSYNAGGPAVGSCQGAITQPFSYIGLGTGTTTETNNDADLQSETATAGLTIAQGTVSWTNSTGGAGTGTAATVVSITKQFTNTGSSTNISEAGLFNDTAVNTNGLFARKTFSPVTVNTNDALTVTWTINIGNSTTLN